MHAHPPSLSYSAGLGRRSPCSDPALGHSWTGEIINLNWGETSAWSLDKCVGQDLLAGLVGRIMYRFERRTCMSTDIIIIVKPNWRVSCPWAFTLQNDVEVTWRDHSLISVDLFLEFRQNLKWLHTACQSPTIDTDLSLAQGMYFMGVTMPLEHAYGKGPSRGGVLFGKLFSVISSSSRVEWRNLAPSASLSCLAISVTPSVKELLQFLTVRVPSSSFPLPL